MLPNNIARHIVRLLCTQIRDDKLTITTDRNSKEHGRADHGPSIRIHDERVYEGVVRGGSVALGDHYADGSWDTDDLTETLRVLLRATAPVLRRQDRVAAFTDEISTAFHVRRKPQHDHDRANIRAHYDLSNEFFALMLDATMAYSCGIFTNPNTTLECASVAKFQAVCDAISLTRDDHLVEIGSGWGGFAIFAANNYGCRVTTTTISDEQFDYTSKRVADAGLANLVTVRPDHYRDLTGTYDKLVSIEMIEAVAWWELNDYFNAVRRLVGPNGSAFIQSINMNNASYARSKRHDDFITHFIFPGSNLPSLNAMTAAALQAGLRLDHLSDIGEHYPATLQAWSENLNDQRGEIASIAPHLANDRFQRLWAFYLAYCQAAFLERHITTTQTVWKPLR